MRDSIPGLIANFEMSALDSHVLVKGLKLEIDRLQQLIDDDLGESHRKFCQEGIDEAEDLIRRIGNAKFEKNPLAKTA